MPAEGEAAQKSTFHGKLHFRVFIFPSACAKRSTNPSDKKSDVVQANDRVEGSQSEHVGRKSPTIQSTQTFPSEKLRQRDEMRTPDKGESKLFYLLMCREHPMNQS